MHTTVPIHEVHHNAAQHHTASALPAVSMADFKKQGGVLTGREERYDGFQGEPRAIGGETSQMGSAGLQGGATGLAGSNAHGTHGHHNNQSGLTGTGASTGSGLGRDREYDNTSNTRSKPSLMDKLNPKKDTDHDGKAGFME